jgi:hypothetical protein
MKYPLQVGDAYRSMPFVVYYKLEPKKKPQRTNYQCFGLMYGQEAPTAIRYIAPITTNLKSRTELDDKAIKFYLDFLKTLLKRPSCPKFMMRRVKGCIHFRLESKGLHYLRMLFFLTLFRYVHQYPEVIQELFFQHKDGDKLEKTFENFYRIHTEVANGKLKVTSAAYTDEMVMYNGYNQVPIPLEKFLQNLDYNAKGSRRVQSYFQS